MTVVGRLSGVVVAAVGRPGVVVMTVVGRPSVGSRFRTDTRAELLNLCRQSIYHRVGGTNKEGGSQRKEDGYGFWRQDTWGWPVVACW